MNSPSLKLSSRRAHENWDMKGAADETRINPTEPDEVRYWRDKFGVSEADLEAAVKKVGSVAVDVDEYFKSRR